MEAPKFEQLPKLVADLTEEVRLMKSLIIQKKPHPKEEEPIKIEEVAELTGYSVSTLYGFCSNGTIPFFKRNSRNFFFKGEIIEWIKEDKRKTSKEIENDVDNFLSSRKSK
ncbi:MAG: helix-turn-helix domain-containing protein [Tenacibaculum sp.]|uniref:helix-turn-helix domain-containing protein n=1 Tax=Tenacibaculum sp. TaxID=1906242 RepID=UPI0017F804D6|nr:helix-turn-helix domain-containing protein [Tenacibaculum sp.]NVK08065.1 helix-turn-helix domain-containing protein [Tenacibaculum sp.]